MSKAKIVYEAIGNEIFKEIAAELRSDKSVIEKSHGDILSFQFDDGSVIEFEGGFSRATCASETVLKLSSKEWSEKFKIVITDPDGWPRDNEEKFEQAWQEKITEDEFRLRLQRSTSMSFPGTTHS